MLPGSWQPSGWRPGNPAYAFLLLASLVVSYYWGRVFSRSFQKSVASFDYESSIEMTMSTAPPVSHSPIPRKKSNRLFSFVFYGDDPMFVQGAVRNAQMIPLLMPGWNTRFYIDGTVSKDFIAEVERQGGETVRVSDEMAGWNELRRIWRYLILDDPNVEYAVFRDIDSRVTIREILAIRAWIDSGIPFHAMHDHPHHTTAILGGMWGAHVPAFRNITVASQSIMNFVRSGIDHSKMGDQTWLAAYIFSLLRDHLLLHDSFVCNQYGVKSHPFPAARSDHADYVGKIIHPNYGPNDPYYVFGSKNFNGTESPQRCRLSPEHAFG